MASLSTEAISFGGITIKSGLPVVTIAEAACQHNGDMATAKRLIEAAKDSGADIIKFQLHVPEAEQVKGAVKFWAGDMEEVLKKVNFPHPAQHKELKEHCEKVGIQYLCTPFCIEAARRLEEVGVEAYKVGSGELSNLPLLRYLARTKKPVIVSTGMSHMEEINDAVLALRDEGATFMLMHTLSEYPPVGFKNMNLRLIEKIRNEFDVLVGLSDHSVEAVELIAAVAVTLGAPVIEKHFTLPDIQGPDDSVSLKPDEFKRLVTAIRRTEDMLGEARYVSEGESGVRAWAHHSVVTSMPIKRGEVLSAANLVPKRPGGGIPAKYLDPLYDKELFGKKAAKDLPEDHMLSWEEVEG